MVEPAEAFGRRLRELRQRRGVSQADLAGEELSPSYVSRLEAGQRVPTDAVVRLLARRLDCRVEDLLFGENVAAPGDVELELRHAELALRSGAAQDALERFERLAALPSQPHLEPLRDAIEYGLAQTLEATGAHETALRHYLAVSRGDPESALVHQATIGVCRCYLVCGDLARCLEVGEPMYRWLSEIGALATDAGAEVTAVLSTAYQERGDLATAQLLAKEALEQAERLADPMAIARSYRAASLAAHERGATGEALRLAERGLATLAGESADEVARLRITYGTLLLRETPPRIDEAVAELTAGRQLLRPPLDGGEHANCLTELARAQLYAGDREAAVATASTAVELAADTRLPAGVRPRLVLAAALQPGGAEADAAADEVRQLLEDGGSTRGWARLWREYGDLLAGRGRIAEALAAYDQALSRSGLAAIAWPAPEVPRSQ